MQVLKTMVRLQKKLRPGAPGRGIVMNIKNLACQRIIIIMTEAAYAQLHGYAL